jgi:hypothetical protein
MVAAIKTLSVSDRKFDLLSTRCAIRGGAHCAGMASGCEIALHFSRVLQPMEVLDALDRLIQIASSQWFTVSRISLDILLKMMSNSEGLLLPAWEGCVPKSHSLDRIIIPDRLHWGDRIKNRICTLLQEIASFPNCFLNSVAKSQLLELRRRLPDPAIFGILSTFSACGLSFAAAVASTGFAAIADLLDDAMLPHFVDLLGSLAGFPELNATVVPLFDVFVFPGILSRDARLAASCLAALDNLASSSPEMLQGVAADASVRTVFEAHRPEAVTALLAFALRLVEAGDASLLGDRRFVRFLKVSLHLTNGG